MTPISVFDIFKIGIGPSSSHTLGPWRAARQFLERCRGMGVLPRIERIEVRLFGSLAKTGKGHGTDLAMIWGLSGLDFATVAPDSLMGLVQSVRTSETLKLDGAHAIPFREAQDIVFDPGAATPYHANAMRFTAYLNDRQTISEVYYSTGGGFVEREGDSDRGGNISPPAYAYSTAQELLQHCEENSKSIAQVVIANEMQWRGEETIHLELARIWRVMREVMHRGCQGVGKLPGPLGVIRRAGDMCRKLLGTPCPSHLDEWELAIRQTAPQFRQTLTWVSCFALAVNEENASFGRVVTAPTNGAAGVIPAVLMYQQSFLAQDARNVETFLLTASAIASLFKHNATISAAMGGCQAEIGVSSAMAASALTACSGGTAAQAMMSAEIAMEHHLGLTCDPVGGLVQIPCIERNAMGAVKALAASELALAGDPQKARVSLDAVIRSMWETARDMNAKYKETSEGGLAMQVPVNVIEC